MEIIVSNEIETVCPNFVGACVEAWVKNSQYSQPLWDEINTLETKFKAELTTETLKDISGIAATRRVSVPVAKTLRAIALHLKRL